MYTQLFITQMPFKKYPVESLIPHVLLSLVCFPLTLEKGFKGHPL